MSMGLAQLLTWIFKLDRRQTVVLLLVIVIMDAIAAIAYLVTTYRRPRRPAGE